jgi:opacity protein-like surface antigen
MDCLVDHCTDWMKTTLNSATSRASLAAAMSLVLTWNAPSPASDRTTIGARAAALGGAYVALAEDGYAVRWNPAGLARLRQHEINSMHTDLFGTGMTASYLSYAFPVDERLGLGVDWVDRSFDDDELSFAQGELGVAAGLRALPWLAVGASGKWHTMDAGLVDTPNPVGFSSKGSGWAMNAGLMAHPWPELSVGLALQDITATDIEYDNGSSQPFRSREWQVGAAYRLRPDLLVSGGLDEARRIGLEYQLRRSLVVRGGFSRDTDDAQGTAYALGAGVRHRFAVVDYAFTETPDLGGTHRFSAGLGFNLSSSVIRIEKLDIDPVFPALQKRYVRDPVGSVRLTNTSRKPVAANVSLYIGAAMESPTEIDQELVLAPGSRHVDLYALFGSELTNWRQNKITTAEVRVSYVDGGRPRSSSKRSQVTVYNANAIRWESIGTAAAFVTPGDKTVDSFARGVIQSQTSLAGRGGSASESLMTAMLVFNAIGLHGVRYLADPNNPYEEIAGREHIVDSIQYPSQLLHSRVGDCDDCTVLYCSLLENLGIRTAVIDAPNHILMAFDTGVSVFERQAVALPAGTFIERNGNLWIPVEVTLFGESFAAAWGAAAEETRRLLAAGELGMVDVQSSWREFPPSPPAAAAAVDLPDSTVVLSRFDSDWQALRQLRDQFLTREYGGTSATELTSDLAPTIIYNLVQLGEYERALSDLDSMANLGADPLTTGNNRAVVLYLHGRIESAIEAWQHLRGLYPDDADVTQNLNIARGQRISAARAVEPGRKGRSVITGLKGLAWK